MKILVFYESIELGGQQTNLINQVQILRELGHEVIWAYTRGEQLKQDIEKHAKLIQTKTNLAKSDVRKRPWKMLLLARDLKNIVLKEKPDFVLAGSGICALISGWATRSVPSVTLWLVGGMMHEVMPTLAKYWKYLPFSHFIDGYLGWPEAFRELQNAGADASKFTPMPFGVDSQLFKPLKPKEILKKRTELGFLPDHLVVGWVGRLSTHMQVRDSILLFKKLHESGLGRARMLIVGGGPAQDEFETLVKRIGLEEFVVFTGMVPMEDVPLLINAMDIVPLLQKDPQGGSIVRETMACGRVALSVNGPSGTQAWFMKPNATILVDPNNYLESACSAVLEHAEHSDRLTQMGKSAREYAVNELSFCKQVEQVLFAAEKARDGKIVSETSEF